MAANFIAAGSLGSAFATANTLTLSEPAGAQEGDLLFMVIAWRLNAGDAVDTLDAAWTEFGRENNGPGGVNSATASAGFVIGMMFREASAPTSGQRTVTWGGATGGGVSGRIFAFRGAILNDMTSIWRTLTAASTTVVTNASNGGPDIDTLEDEAALFMVCVNARSDGSITGQKANTDPTSGWTELTDDFPANGNIEIATAFAVKATAGNTGSFQWTAGNSALHSIWVVCFYSKPSVSIAPGVASAVGNRNGPDVLAGGLSILPQPAEVRGQVVAPSVRLGSLSVAPQIAAAKGDTVNPSLAIGLFVTPEAAEARGETAIEDILEELGPVFGPVDPISNFWTPEVPLD